MKILMRSAKAHSAKEHMNKREKKWIKRPKETVTMGSQQTFLAHMGPLQWAKLSEQAQLSPTKIIQSLPLKVRDKFTLICPNSGDKYTVCNSHLLQAWQEQYPDLQTLLLRATLVPEHSFFRSQELFAGGGWLLCFTLPLDNDFPEAMQFLYFVKCLGCSIPSPSKWTTRELQLCRTSEITQAWLSYLI